RNLGDIGDAANDLQKKIDRSTRALAVLEQQSKVFAESGGRDVEVIVDDFGRNLSTTPQSAKEFGEVINRLKAEIDGLKNALASLGPQVAAFISGNKLTVEGFEQQQLALGRTQRQINGTIIAFNAFNAQQPPTAAAIAQATNAIDKQRAAIEALKQAINNFNFKPLTDKVQDSINQIAATAKNASDARTQLAKLRASDASVDFAIKESQRIREAQAALNEALNPASRTGAARRVAAERRAEASAELKILQQAERERELQTRRETERLRRSLDDRLINVRDFTDRAIALDKALLAAKLATLKEEEDAAVRSAKNKLDAEARRNEIRLRAEQAVLDSELRIEDLRRQRRDAERRAEEEHQQALVEIRDISRQSEEDAIRTAVSESRVGDIAGEQRLIELQRERFDDRQNQLRQEFILAGANLQEQRRVNDELAKIAAERAAFEVEASARIRAAQKAEAGEFAAFIKAKVDALVDLRRAQIEAQVAQAALAAQRGLLTPRDAQAQELERRRELIRIDSLERQRAIEQQALDLEKQARQAQLGAAVLLEIERQKNAALKAERDRATAEQQAITEQQRAAQITPAFGEQAAAAIAGIETSLERQLTLWEANRVAMGVFTQELLTASQNAFASATNVLGNFTNALSSAIDVFVQSGGSLKAAGRAIISALATPFIEAAKARAKFEAAAALASLAVFDIRGALLHGLAAAGFAALAGIGTALISGGGGGSVAGSSIAAGGGGAGSSQSGPRIIEQGDRVREQQPIVIKIEARADEGVIVRRVEENFRSNGQLRQMIRRDLIND
ncbi:MAG: hypothetical protein MOB07_06630, partial [Acidobacteria bacterium]|nr:hypothetical protein [Acidobacteriota bacterium]